MGVLRVILATAVVIVHSNSFFGFKFTGNIVSVELFFLISGFYMTMILTEKYTGKGSYRLFISNRFLRIYPIYWVVLLLVIIALLLRFLFFHSWGGLSPFIEYFHVLPLGTLFFQLVTNIVIFGQDVVLFLGINPSDGSMYFTKTYFIGNPISNRFMLLPQAWTLSLELMFYLVAPFLVRRSLKLIIGLIISSMAVRIITYYWLGCNHEPWIYKFFPSEIALFLMGALAYRLYLFFRGKKYFNTTNQFLVTTAFLSIVIFYQFIPYNTGNNTHIINWTIYFLALLSIPFVFHLSKTSKYDKKIGELSYPIYISQALVFTSISPFATRLGFDRYGGEINVAATILISYILVRLVSDPIEKIRQVRVDSAHNANFNDSK